MTASKHIAYIVQPGRSLIQCLMKKKKKVVSHIQQRRKIFPKEILAEKFPIQTFPVESRGFFLGKKKKKKSK